VTVPSATRCNRRVAPGRLSPAAFSGRDNPAPPRGALSTGAAAGRVPSVARTRARASPTSPLPCHRSVRANRLRRRQPPPAAAPPAPHRRRPRRGRGSRSTTFPSAEKELSPTTPPDSPVGAPSASPPARPAADPVKAPAAASPAGPSAVIVAPGAVPAPFTPATPGPTRARPPIAARPLLPPGLQLPYDPNGREWRKPLRPTSAAAATSGEGGAATPQASAGGAGPAPAPGGGPAVVPGDRPPLLGQAAPVLPPRPAPPAFREWLAPLGPVVAAADRPLVSNVFRSSHLQDAIGTHAVWRAFREFAAAAGYDARLSAERDFGSFIRSVGSSSAWLRCMLRRNAGRVLLVPHTAAVLPFIAGAEDYAYQKDWHTRLRHHPAVPFGHSLALVNFGDMGPLIVLSPVGPPTAPADLALEAARRSRGELVSTLRAGHGEIFVPWTAVHDRLPYHHDLTRQASSTLLPHQVGTVADRRCHNVRVVSVPRSPQAPLGVMLAEPRLADVVPRALLVTEEAWVVRAGFTLPDPGDVPPWTEEVAASAAYRARKRRHGDMERGGPAQPGPADPGSQAVASPGTPAGPAAFHTSGSPIHEPGSRGPGGVEGEARAWGAAGSSASPRGVAAWPPAANADWDRYPAARDDGSGTAHDDRWADKRHDDYPGGAGPDFESGWPTAAGGGAIGARPDHGDPWEGRDGRGADAEDDRAWPAASQDDGRGHAASSRYAPMCRSDHGQGRGGDPLGGRQWDAEPRRDGGGYPAAGVGAAAGSQSDAHGGRHWGAEPRRDGGGYVTAGAGAAAGSQCGALSGRHWDSEPRRDGGEYNTAGAGTAAGASSARWDAGPDSDGPAAALLELGFAGPVATPVPGQPDVA